MKIEISKFGKHPEDVIDNQETCHQRKHLIRHLGGNHGKDDFIGVIRYHLHFILRYIGDSVGRYRPYRSDRRFIEGYREGFTQVLNWWESAHAHFEVRLSCT